jgi:hypothetical protein
VKLWKPVRILGLWPQAMTPMTPRM